MRIKKLHLKDLGHFDEKVFNLNDLTVVCGENRTGKSTFVYSLYFALFGKHLHSGLQPEDLCRKGKSFGEAKVIFEVKNQFFRLTRPTNSTSRISFFKDNSWQDSSGSDISKIVSMRYDISALTSFFREGELIYFLQDLPRYNKTLLENLIGSNDLQAVRVKFKKALKIAKERTQEFRLNKFPQGIFENLEKLGDQKKELEKKFQIADEDFENNLKFATPNSQTVNYEMLKILKENFENRKIELEKLQQEQMKSLSVNELEKQKGELLAKMQFGGKESHSKSELEKSIYSLKDRESDLSKRLRKIVNVGKSCPTCSQDLEETQVENLKKSFQSEILKINKKRLTVEASLEKLLDLERNSISATNSLKFLEQELEKRKEKDFKIKKLVPELEDTENKLKVYSEQIGNLTDFLEKEERLQKIKKNRQELRKQLIKVETEISNGKLEIEKIEKLKRDKKLADRKLVLCQVAHNSLESAFEDLISELLEKVRESITSWIPKFQFLDSFEISLTVKELRPLINAKGYEYKLQQMSKSERIFLYLLLKLAIGDSLGHLGIFVLDDPADGLDSKQQRTLAYLLIELSKSRQVIVTTNDENFAKLFNNSLKIQL